MPSLVKRLYNLVFRPYTPLKIASFNGVPVRCVHLFDLTDEFPAYEQALLDGIRENISPGDDVVVVGGGRGVSSTVAARQSAPCGSVTAFEGSRERIEMARKTVQLSRVEGAVKFVHAIVGENIEVAGDTTGVQTVQPADLPSCDVVVLDCEGAEIGILNGLEHRPRVIIVETHAYLGSPEADVREALDDIGYNVVARGTELEEKGVFVLTAVRA